MKKLISLAMLSILLFGSVATAQMRFESYGKYVQPVLANAATTYILAMDTYTVKTIPANPNRTSVYIVNRSSWGLSYSENSYWLAASTFTKGAPTAAVLLANGGTLEANNASALVEENKIMINDYTGPIYLILNAAGQRSAGITTNTVEVIEKTSGVKFENYGKFTSPVLANGATTYIVALTATGVFTVQPNPYRVSLYIVDKSSWGIAYMQDSYWLAASTFTWGAPTKAVIIANGSTLEGNDITVNTEENKLFINDYTGPVFFTINYSGTPLLGDIDARGLDIEIIEKTR